MEYSKLPPQPPPYSQEQYGAGPSAPPTEQFQPAVAAQPPRPDVHVVNTNNVIVDSSGLTTCPRCNKRILIRMKHHATCTTYCWAAVLCALLWVLNYEISNENLIANCALPPFAAAGHASACPAAASGATRRAPSAPNVMLASKAMSFGRLSDSYKQSSISYI